MQFRLIALLVGMLLAVTGQAHAQNAGYGSGMKDRVMIPAPIPDHGAIAVPAGVPVPEGFTYYLRADLGWGFAGSRSYSENGAVYGAPTDTAPFNSTLGAFGLSGGDAKGDGVFLGTVGWGAYFTPRLRGDLTIDFRSKQDLTSDVSYAYTSTTGTTTVAGAVTDRVRMNSAVFLANLYFDLLPRGAFTPYIGAGVGFVYNDAARTYTDTATPSDGTLPDPDAPRITTATSKEKNVALAAALMAGVTFAIDQHWLIDVNYRALYLGGIDITTSVNSPSFATSRASLGDVWEHQARIGLRYNIW
jgi:opacity protein-like surface antigen